MIFDAAIVGAGPAGSATATHLARAGFRVVAVDKSAFPRHKPCAEYLSPAAEPLLRELGALEAIEETRPSHLRGFRIFAPDGTFFQGDFAATTDEQGHSLFESGLAVPRYRLDAALVDAARAAGAEIRENWRLAQIKYDGKVHMLTPAGEHEPITARMIIAADGLHSTIAQRLGLSIPSRMQKIALVAHMRGIVGLSDYGEMHVANRRYVGLAPLESRAEGDLCNVAMVVDEGRDGHAIAGRPEAFLIEALQTFPKLRGRLDNLSVTRKTLAISRLNVRTRRLSGDGLLLVGDAGGYYDPFTGEGIYRALRGASLASSVAIEALRNGDLSATALARYDRLQHAEFRGKRIIEAIIQASVQVPPMMNHISWAMRRRKAMADTIVAVTGDFLSPWAVLNPGYLIRLVV